MLSTSKILRNLLSKNKLITAPGVYDGISTKVAAAEGFEVLYASGGAIARSFGRPDIGRVTRTEQLFALGNIVASTNLPVIADADTGYGNAINVADTVAEYERVGVAGLHIEDQAEPKKCGHLGGKSVVPVEEMCAKIVAARKSRKNPDFVLIARTDAIAVEGFESAMERAQSYLEAGADMIFVEAPESVEQIKEIAARIKAPKLINMFIGGKTPLVSREELEQLGYNIMIIPSALQCAAIYAMKKASAVIKKDGNTAALGDEITSFKEREEIIETKKYFEFDEECMVEALRIKNI